MQAQAVRGVVRDASAGLPIAGTIVLLLDAQNTTRLRVRTDVRGRFFLRAPSEGQYTVYAERDGYASAVSEVLSLGVDEVPEYSIAISALRTPATEVALAAGEDAADAQELDPFEAAQRFATLIVQACEGEFDATRHGILVGTVKDSVSNVPLPMVETIDRVGGGAGFHGPGPSGVRPRHGRPAHLQPALRLHGRLREGF